MRVTKQSIAIIGAGSNIGSAITKHMAGSKCRLLLFDRDIGKLQSLANTITEDYDDADLITMDCAHSCSWEADIIIMAVSHNAEKEIAENIREVATQKIVISITDSVDGNLKKSKLDPQTHAAKQLRNRLPHSKIIKAFSPGFYQQVADLDGEELFISGNDKEALEKVAKLAVSAGLKPVIAG